VLAILELFIGAGILGITIAVMERGEFPGWGSMVIAVLAALIPAVIINALLPGQFFFVGLAVGAVCAGFAISALCGMTVARAMMAAAIYLVIQTVISLGFYAMLRAR
jgi:hypothetical protein